VRAEDIPEKHNELHKFRYLRFHYKLIQPFQTSAALCKQHLKSKINSKGRKYNQAQQNEYLI